MRVEIISLGENTTFLVAGNQWINIEEIKSIEIDPEQPIVVIRLVLDKKRYSWINEDAEDLKEFLQNKLQNPWESR